MIRPKNLKTVPIETIFAEDFSNKAVMIDVGAWSKAINLFYQRGWYIIETTVNKQITSTDKDIIKNVFYKGEENEAYS